MQLSEQQALDRADIAFIGTVSKKWLAKDQHGIGRYSVSFKVERMLKGEFKGPSLVSTPEHGATCGYGFVEGQRYKVFAHKWNDSYSSSLCSGNQPL